MKRILVTLCALALAVPAFGAVTIVQSVGETADSPTPTDNDFTRINDAILAATDGDTIQLQGTFDWTEANADASWTLGSDGVDATGDEYYLNVPPLDNFTITAASLGDAVIQGPGDLPGVDLEGVFIALSVSGDPSPNLTISNLMILDFDLSIGMFHNGGSITAFNNSLITNNFIRMPSDVPGHFILPDYTPVGEAYQNIGIHYAFGDNQTISNNVIEIPGDGLSDRSDPDPANYEISASVGMQSNTSGGAYEGLLIDGNEIRILNAQSADPEVIYGIWENGHAHTKNITVSNNRFLNMAAGNDPALNIQNAFRVSSHSSLSSTVTYSGNEVQGTNVGLAQMLYSTPIDFSGHEPIQVIGNTFLDNESAVLVRAGGNDVLRCNRFFGNALAIGNTGTPADAAALENWFGCNAGPGFGACDTIDATVDASLWITMGLSIDKPILGAGETATVTADLKRNSGGGLASCAMPDGAEVDFSASGGTISPGTATLAGGLAQATYTAGADSTLASLIGLIDGQLEAIFASVFATDTNLSVTKTNDLAIWDAGATTTYVIVVTNAGPSNVFGATLQDSLPALLSGCTWTCTSLGVGSCPSASGAGDLNETLNLQVGDSLSYEVTCTFPAAESGDTIVNTATVSVPVGMTDTDLSDNTASDVTQSPFVRIFEDGFESGNLTAWSASVP